MAEFVAVPFYEPGTDITATADGEAVIGKRFVIISDDQNADGTLAVTHAAAAGRIAGVSDRSAADGGRLGVMRAPGRVVPVLASAAIAAFAEVEVAADGKAVTKTAGVAVGYAITAALINTDAKISLY